MEAGLDGGNNTIILSIEGNKGKDAIIVPTAYAPYYNYDLGLGSKKSNLIDNLDMSITLYTNNKEKSKSIGRVIVGNAARIIEEEKSVTRQLGNKKCGDVNLLIPMIGTLAYGAVVSQKKQKGKITQEYQIVTGLPFLQFNEDKAIYASQFIGKHHVVIHGENDIEIDLVINDVSVEAEGSYVILNSIFDNDGNYIYTEDELFEKIVVCIDPGEYTTEIIAIIFVDEEGEVVPKFRHKLCTGIDLGIANAKQPIIDKLREHHNKIIDRYTIDKVIKSPRNKGIIVLPDGSNYNIIEEYDSKLKDLAYNIAKVLNDKVRNAGDMGKILKVILCGGGPCVLDNKMGSYLRDFVEENLRIKSNEKSNENSLTEVANNSLTANADAFLEKAIEIFSKDSDETFIEKPDVKALHDKVK